MCDWSSRGKTEVAKSNTALREQGRHLSLKGGRSYVATQHALQPCNPFALAVDCSPVLLPLEVGRV
jgi:hypothetical protein